MCSQERLFGSKRNLILTPCADMAALANAENAKNAENGQPEVVVFFGYSGSADTKMNRGKLKLHNNSHRTMHINKKR